MTRQSKIGRHLKTGHSRPFKYQTGPVFGSPLYLILMAPNKRLQLKKKLVHILLILVTFKTIVLILQICILYSISAHCWGRYDLGTNFFKNGTYYMIPSRIICNDPQYPSCEQLTCFGRSFAEALHLPHQAYRSHVSFAYFSS